MEATEAEVGAEPVELEAGVGIVEVELVGLILIKRRYRTLMTMGIAIQLLIIIMEAGEEGDPISITRITIRG
jgi:hypothetical protein